MKVFCYLVTTICALIFCGCAEKKELTVDLVYGKIPTANGDSDLSIYADDVFFLQLNKDCYYTFLDDFIDVKLDVTLLLGNGTTKKGKLYWASWNGRPRKLDINRFLDVEKCFVKGTCSRSTDSRYEFQGEWIKR